MKVKFENCDLSNNGKDGALFSGRYSVEFVNSSTNNNGRNGVTLGGDAEATFINHVAHNNGAYGVSDINDAILSDLGLPAATNINELKQLLIELKTVEPSKKETVVKSSFLSDFIANSANGTTIIANLILLAEKLNSVF
ncbi:right-handed parallel beta-helix repeat-containing protein [Acinetobacter baumannii]